MGNFLENVIQNFPQKIINNFFTILFIYIFKIYLDILSKS